MAESRRRMKSPYELAADGLPGYDERLQRLDSMRGRSRIDAPAPLRFPQQPDIDVQSELDKLEPGRFVVPTADQQQRLEAGEPPEAVFGKANVPHFGVGDNKPGAEKPQTQPQQPTSQPETQSAAQEYGLGLDGNTSDSKENNFGLRRDGTKKGTGFLGILERPDGRVSTELSIGVQMDGKEIEIPSLVPTLSQEEVDSLLAGGEITEDIARKAIDFARKRMRAGKSPFLEPGEDRHRAGITAEAVSDDYGWLERTKDFLFPGNRDAAAVERAAQQIAQEEGISVDEVYENAGGRRGWGDPEGRGELDAFSEGIQRTGTAIDQAGFRAEAEGGGSDEGYVSELGDAFSAGWLNMTESLETSLFILGGGDTKEQSEMLANKMRRNAARSESESRGKAENTAAFGSVSDSSGFSETFGASISALKQAIFNDPAATSIGIAEQSSNVLPSAGGALVGAGVGAPAGAPGMAVGSRAGFAVGTAAVELGFEVEAMVSEELDKRGVTLDSESLAGEIEKIISDEDFRGRARRQGLKKGLSLAAIDSVFMKLSGRAATSPGRNAAQKSEELGREFKPTKTQRTKAGAAAFGIESVGEGVAEAGSQAFARGEVDAGDALMEGVYGAGMAAGGTAVGATSEAGMDRYRQTERGRQGQLRDEMNAAVDGAGFTTDPRDIALNRLNPDNAQMEMQPAGPISRSLDKGAQSNQAYFEEPDDTPLPEAAGRVRVRAPDGTEIDGELTGYRFFDDGRFDAEVLTDDGMITRLSNEDGVTIDAIEPEAETAPEAEAPAQERQAAELEQPERQQLADLGFSAREVDGMDLDVARSIIDGGIENDGSLFDSVGRLTDSAAQQLGIETRGRADLEGDQRQPESANTEPSEVSRDEDISATSRDTDDALIFKSDGSPFASRETAEQAAKNRRLSGYQPMQVDGGWALGTTTEQDGDQLSDIEPVESQSSGEVETVSTPAGRDVDIEYDVVEASSLIASNDESGAVNPDYPQNLQPRDRSRDASRVQINDISRNINPRLLGRSPSTSDGAPVVSPDNVVESGNGRTLALRKAYREGNADAYRQWLTEQGFNAAGMNEPVLVRRRRTEMSPEELVEYTRESNERTTMGMSATEQAQADAEAIMPIIGDYVDGDLDRAANRDFVRKFMRDVVPASERGDMMDSQGLLSQDGKRRIGAALMAAAYGDPNVVADVFESNDTDIKAIGGALLDVAGKWAQMREAAQSETMAEGIDVTDNLIEAVNIVRRARAEGKPVSTIAGTDDIFDGGIDSDTASFLSIFYRGESMRRARGRDKVADALSDYTDRAMATEPGAGLFGDTITSEQILRGVTNELQGQTESVQPASNADAEQPGGQGQGSRAETKSEATDQESDRRESPVTEQPQTESAEQFTPTHELPGGELVAAVEGETDVYVNAEGVEIEDANATPIEQSSDLQLESQTQSDIDAAQQAQQEAAQQAEREQAEAERRAQADLDRDEFNLTGSNSTRDVMGARGQTDISSATDEKRPSNYGDNNKLVTKDRAKDLRDQLKKKLNGSQLNSGIDPEILSIGAQLAAFHIEAGARKFADFVRAISDDLDMSPQDLTQYLRSWYNGSRDLLEDSGMDVTGMDSPDQVRTQLQQIREGNQNDQRTAVDTPATGQGNEGASAEADNGDAGRGGSGQQADEAGTQAGTRGGAGAAVDNSGTTPDRESGNQPVRGEKSQLEYDAAGDIDDPGSRASSTGGLLADQESSQDINGIIEKAPAKKPTVKRGSFRKVTPGDTAEIAQQMPFLTSRQVEDVSFAEARFSKPDGFGVLFTNGTGTGKAQPLDADVLTPTGWIDMGNVAVGDLVVGQNGKPTPVVGVYPQGDKPIYEITFSDGSVTRCCDEHLWETQTLYERRKASQNPGWECAKPKVRSLAEIRDTIDLSHFIPLVEPVEFECTESIVFSPYTMGALLGDGCFRTPTISISNPDEEIAARIYSEMPESINMVAYKEEKKCTTYKLTNSDGSGRGVQDEIEKLGLAGIGSESKFIPKQYLYRSVSDRIALLQGLLDTDGTADKHNCVYYTTVSPILCADISELIQSLGGTAKVSTKIPKYSYAGERRAGKLAYTIKVNLPGHVKPFSLGRKAARIKDRKWGKVCRKIVSIDYIGQQAAQCIAVDDPRHLYVTDSYIVTHNTFTALGAAKRAYESGQKNILVVVPKQTISDAWVKAGRDFFDLPITPLENTGDAGEGMVVTTFANLAYNDAVVSRSWDMVIPDEAHYLSSDQAGSETQALNKIRMLTLKRNVATDRVYSQNPKMVERMRSLYSEAEQKRKSDNEKDWAQVDGLVEKADAVEKELRELVDAERERLAGIPDNDKPRGLFLSATPFAYEKSVKWANEFLFDWGTDADGLAYNNGGSYERFMMEHFGYRMRYNKLTEPDAKVDRGFMQRAFNGWLQKEGVLSGRMLDSDYDYDRLFVMADNAIGRRVDDALEWISDRMGGDGAVDGMQDLHEKMIKNNFDYFTRMYFLEAIKAREAVDYIKGHVDAGRKVLLVHDFKKGGAVNPFRFQPDEKTRNAYRMFKAEFPDLIESFESLPSVVETMAEAFPDALIYNGDVSAKKRVEMQDAFNRDNSDSPKILVAQSDAVREGVSIHDTTGKWPRVMMNLGMPGKPTAAIQIEGRTYRTGQASDAMFRYITIGTNWERMAFASKIASRASAAENLAMGEKARGLKESFINAYEQADAYPPGFEGEGTGGREQDKMYAGALTPWEQAKSFYYASKKQGSGRSARGREQSEFFATPEPLGMKMVQWADIRPGEDVLEPSAGNGSIARFFPENAEGRAIELTPELSSRLALHFDGDLMTGDFMDHHIVNKYDAIVMNPPFGRGGAQAAEHVGKAMKHIRDGGRIVALVPEGPTAEKQLDKLMESDTAKNIYQVANIKLPRVTFERAGTQISARVVVFERQDDTEVSERLLMDDRDYSGVDKIDDFFDRLETSEIHERFKSEPPEVEGAPIETGGMETWQAEHTKTGDTLYMAKPQDRVEKADFAELRARAKENGGYWSRFGKAGFLFKDEESRQAFMDAVARREINEPVADYAGYEQADAVNESNDTESPQLELFAEPDANKRESYADLYGTVVRAAPVTSLPASSNNIAPDGDGAQNFADMMASIRKNAQEFFYAVVTDADNNVLRVMQHTKGGIDVSSVYPLVVVAEVASIPGADTLHMAHNHPTGDPSPSRADINITNKINSLLDGTGIKPGYHVVVGDKTWDAVVSDEGVISGGGNLKPVRRTARVPVTERRFARRGSLGPSVGSATAAQDMTANHENAVFLMDTKNAPVAIIPMTAEEMSSLRAGQSNRLLSAINKSNANTAIIKGGNRESAANVVRFLTRFGNDMRVLDWIRPDGTSDSVGNGGVVDERGEFYSVNRDVTRPLDSDGLKRTLLSGRLGGVVSQLLDNGSVVIHASSQAMPGKNEGAAVTRGDKIHLAASSLTEGSAVPVLMHEAFHAGTEKMLGTEQWNKLMSRLGSLYRQYEQSNGKARVFWDAARDRVAYAKGVGIEMSDAITIEEFGAYAIEEYASAPASIKKWVDDLIGAVKSFLLRRFNIQAGKVTPSQLASLATAALRDAALGAPTPTVAQRSENFNNWFGESVLVNQDGTPQMLFHGTSDDIAVFDLDHENRKDTGWLGTGVYLTDSPYLAGEYARIKPGAASPNVIPVNARLENPYIATREEKSQLKNSGREGADRWTEKVRSLGHDGVILEMNGAREIVIFDPAGVKSTVGNRGTFDLSDPDIRNSIIDRTNTPEFKAWFGDSQVTDNNGNPIIVYHGAPDMRFVDEDGQFKSQRDRFGMGSSTGVHWFSKDRAAAKSYADDNRAMDYQNAEPGIIPAYLKMENPLVIDGKGGEWRDVQARGKTSDVIEQAISEGHDGVIIKNVRDNYNGNDRARPTDTYAVFDSRNIKHAVGNRGTFDSSDPDIRYSVRPEDQFEDLDADQKSLMGKVGPQTFPQRMQDRMQELTENLGLRMRQAGVDRYAALMRNDYKLYGEDMLEGSIASSSWVLARMSESAGGALASMIKTGRIYLDTEQKVMDVREGTSGLGDTLRKLGSPAEIDRFMAWIASNRAKGLMDEGRENLFTKQEIKAGIRLSQGRTKDDINRAALYSEVWKEFKTYRDDVLGIAQDAGIITPEQRETWAEEFYVPFYRVLDEDSMSGPVRSGGDGLSRQQAYKRLKGGKQNLNDLLENTLLNYHHLLQASLKNQAAIQAVDNAIELEIAKQVPVSRRDKKNSTYIMRNGIKEWYDVSDPLTFKAISSIPDVGLNNAPMRVMRGFKRFFTNMVTLTVQFLAANTFRDTLSAIGTSPVSFNPVKNLVHGAATFGNDYHRARMLSSGGAFSFGHIYGTTPDDIKSSMRGSLKREGLTDTTSLSNPFGYAWRKWNDAANFAENINRGAIWKQNLDKGKLKAAFESRDLMDFSARGDALTVRFLTDVVAFLNARIQGGDKLYRSGFKPGAKVLTGRGDKRDKKSFARFMTVVGAVSIYSAYNLLRNWDDEEYRKLEDWQKDTYWVERIGDQMYFFPKPFEIGAIGTMVERALEQYVDPSVGGAKFAERFGRMLMDTFALDPTPQAFKPLLELANDKDSFTGRPIEGYWNQRLSPHLRSRPETTRFAEYGSLGMESSLGLVSDTAGDVALSPLQIDHLISGYTGQVGTYAVGLADTFWRRAMGEENPARRWYEYQPIRRFYKDLDDVDQYNRYGTLFYDTLNTADKAYANLRRYEELEQFDKAEKEARDNETVLGIRPSMTRVRNQIGQINREIRRIKRNKDMSGEAKRMELDRLYEIRTMTLESVGKDIEQEKMEGQDR